MQSPLMFSQFRIFFYFNFCDFGFFLKIFFHRYSFFFMLTKRFSRFSNMICTKIHGTRWLIDVFWAFNTAEELGLDAAPEPIRRRPQNKSKFRHAYFRRKKSCASHLATINIVLSAFKTNCSTRQSYRDRTVRQEYTLWLTMCIM